MQQAVEADPAHADARYLAGGSIWLEFGAIAQGTVYKPRDSALTLAKTNMHEAYVVVREGRLVGLWLPVEEAFAPMAQEVAIDLRPEARP